MSRIAAALLSLEAVVIALAVPAALTMSDVEPWVVWTTMGGAVLGCILAAATVSRGAIGYWLGSAVQVVAMALGFLTGAMFLLGALFAGLWILMFRLGSKVEQAKANQATNDS